jgi:hypothetical protein
MVSSITPERRKELEDFLKKHPIDPAYDEECHTLDGTPPEDQMTARIYKKILEDTPE